MNQSSAPPVSASVILSENDHFYSMMFNLFSIEGINTSNVINFLKKVGNSTFYFVGLGNFDEVTKQQKYLQQFIQYIQPTNQLEFVT